MFLPKLKQTLFSCFCENCNRNLSHTVTEFNLITAYNAPGQGNISDEDDKEKVFIQPKIECIKDCTKVQIEDIVKGWMRYIRKVLKSYEQKVIYIRLIKFLWIN